MHMPIPCQNSVTWNSGCTVDTLPCCWCVAGWGSLGCNIPCHVPQAKFGYRLDDPKWAPDWLPNEQLEMLHSDVDARQIVDGEFDQLLQDLKVCCQAQ